MVPVVAQHQHPRVERAGHHRGEQAVAGDEVEPLALVVARSSHWPAPCPWPQITVGVDSAAALHECHRVAARPVHVRLDDVQHEAGRDRGIEGVAALLEDGHADLRGGPVRGRDDAEAADDLGPGW